ncbi:MAG: beta-ketoacyl-ACP synthase III [Candidatus Omnitrophota bacterium]
MKEKKTKSKDDFSVGIAGLGAYVPERVLTNFDLEKMVETSDEWITTRTGIKERHIARKDETTSDLAVNAARQALENAGLSAKDVELIIVATITPDMFFPSTACLVQNKLEAFKAACFDVSAACSGYIYAITCAQQFIKAGTYKNALVIGAEKLSSITDWTDRNTCILFGDGAGACVLEKVVSGTGIISTYLGADGRESELLSLPGGGSKIPSSHESVNEKQHFIKMKGNELFKIAVKKMADAVNIALKKAGIGCEEVDCIVPHQANIRIINACARRLGLPLEVLYLNIAKCGNMSSASSAVALYDAYREGRIKKGSIVVMTAFGGGLTWGACVIKW